MSSQEIATIVARLDDLDRKQGEQTATLQRIERSITGGLDGRPGLNQRVAENASKLATISRFVWITITGLVTLAITTITTAIKN